MIREEKGVPEQAREHIASILFWTIEHRRLRFSQDDYEPILVGGKWQVKDSVMMNDYRLRREGMTVFGSSDSADDILGKFLKGKWQEVRSDPKFHVDSLTNFDLSKKENQLYYLVYVQTKKDSKWVGGPITVVKVTNNEPPQWIYNKIGTVCY